LGNLFLEEGFRDFAGGKKMNCLVKMGISIFFRANEAKPADSFPRIPSSDEATRSRDRPGRRLLKGFGVVIAIASFFLPFADRNAI